MRLAFFRKGEAANAALEAVNAAWKAGFRDTHPEIYSALLDAHRAAVMDALPSSDGGFMARLDAGHPDAVDRAIAFLQADPWCDRSGYEKAGLIRYLKRAPLTNDQMQDLAAIVLMVVDRRYRLEFKHYCRLARRVRSPDLVAGLVARAEGDDLHVARRATWVLHSLQVHS